MSLVKSLCSGECVLETKTEGKKNLQQGQVGPPPRRGVTVETPGAGAEDCITRARRLERAPLVSRPRRRPTRRHASPAPLSAQTVAGWFGLG